MIFRKNKSAQITAQIRKLFVCQVGFVFCFLFFLVERWYIPFVSNSGDIWIDFTAFCHFSRPVWTCDERCLNCRFQFYPLSSVFFSLDYGMTPVLFQRSVVRSHLEDKFCIYESKTTLLTLYLTGTHNIQICCIQLFTMWGIWGDFWYWFPFNLFLHT